MKINDAFAINVLTRKLAIEAVKARLKAQGLRRPWETSFRELQIMAREYLDENEAALIAQAKEKWRQMNEPRTRASLVVGAAVRPKASA
jgi:hypothetical protein